QQRQAAVAQSNERSAATGFGQPANDGSFRRRTRSAQRLQCWIERLNLAIGHVYRVTPGPESFRSVQDSIYGWWQVRGNHCSTVGGKKIVRLSECKRSNHRFAALDRRVAGNSGERRTTSASPSQLRRCGHSFTD